MTPTGRGNVTIETFNPKDKQDAPPFNQWIYLDMGDYFTFGRILKYSPNGNDLDEYEWFKSSGDSYRDFQFCIQDMTTIEIPAGHFEEDIFSSDLLSDYSDSIKAWGNLPYNTEIL